MKKNKFSTAEFVVELRRLADALEKGESFAIPGSGEEISVPATAAFDIDYEREKKKEELEIKIKWKNPQAAV